MPPSFAPSEPVLRIASPKAQFPRSSSNPEGGLRRQVLRPKPIQIPTVKEGGSAARSPTDRAALNFRESSDQKSPTDRDARSYTDSWKELRHKGKKIDRTQRVISEIQINVDGDDKIYYCFGIDEADDDDGLEDGSQGKHSFPQVAVPAEIFEATIAAHGSIEKLREELKERRELLKARWSESKDRPSALAGVMVADQSVLDYFNLAEDVLTQQDKEQGNCKTGGGNGSLSLGNWGNQADTSVSLAGWGGNPPGNFMHDIGSGGSMHGIGSGANSPARWTIPESGECSPAHWGEMGNSLSGSPARWLSNNLSGSGANSPAHPVAGKESPGSPVQFALGTFAQAGSLHGGKSVRGFFRNGSMKGSSRLGPPAAPSGEAGEWSPTDTAAAEREGLGNYLESPSVDSISEWSLQSSSIGRGADPSLPHAESRDSLFFQEVSNSVGNHGCKSHSSSDVPVADLDVLSYFEQKEASLSADNLAVEGFGSIPGTDPDVLEYFMRKAVLFSEDDYNEESLGQGSLHPLDTLA